MECTSISYSFRVVSTRFNEKEMCQTKVLRYNAYYDVIRFEGKDLKEFNSHKFPPQFIRKLVKIKNNISDEEGEYCKRNLQYRAEVVFKMATDSMSVTVMSSRLSFFDKMSAFGKIGILINLFDY